MVKQTGIKEKGVTKMKTLKKITLVIIIILLIAGIVIAFLGGFMPLFCIPIGFLFLYYLIIYIAIVMLAKHKNKLFIYICSFFILIPLAWLLIDWESLIDFLMQSVHIDFR